MSERAGWRERCVAAEYDRDTYRAILAGVCGALLDAGSIHVPDMVKPLDEAVRALVAERDTARQEAEAAKSERDKARRNEMPWNLENVARRWGWDGTQALSCFFDDQIYTRQESLARLQQEREGLIAILKKCAGWVLIRIEGNIEQHGVCASCSTSVAGTNPGCPVCRWIINARAFYEDITKALMDATPTPPTEAQETTR